MIINGAHGVTAAGRATRDAEFKVVGENNTHLTKLSIVGIDGTPEKPTKYVNVIAWFDLADYAKSVKKGDRVFVAGTLKDASYKNRDGELVPKSELVADFMQIQERVNKTEPPVPAANDGFYDIDESVDDEDLPF